MTLTNAPKLATRNVVFLLFCLGGIASLYLVGLLPFHFESKELDKKTIELKRKVSVQTQLEAMLTIIDKDQYSDEASSELPKIVVTSLAPDQTDQILPDFETIASQSKLTVIEVSPRLKKAADLKRIEVTAKLKGDFKNIRSLLYDLLSLAYVSQINKIEIMSSGEKIQCNLTYSVNLS